jgi:excisionase family DNA binding protein
MPRFPLLAKKAFLSAKSFSFFSGLTRQTVNKLVDSGEIKSVLLRGRRLIPIAELDRFTLQLELFDDHSGEPSNSSSSDPRGKVGQ